MPRYHFHLIDGTHVLKTHQGLELPGNAAAREEAVRLARELRHGTVLPRRKWDDWFVSIVDGHSHEVDRIPIAAVPEEPPLAP